MYQLVIEKVFTECEVRGVYIHCLENCGGNIGLISYCFYNRWSHIQCTTGNYQRNMMTGERILDVLRICTVVIGSDNDN